MGYEVRYHYHPKKEDGVGYDMDKKEVMTKKVGKSFDDTPLEKLAGAVMSQMARRDVLIFDVEVDEFVRKSINFKETKDGRGIVLKNKRFSFNSTADMVSCDVHEEVEHHEEEMYPHEVLKMPQQPKALPQGVQPHEIANQDQMMESLYAANPNRNVPVRRQALQKKYNINPNKVLYWVYFEPEFYVNQARAMNLKFTPNKKYPVHHVVQHPNGRIDFQKLVLTDDTGKQVEVEDKFFTSAGFGLTGGFEADVQKTQGRQAKLMYEDELVIDPSKVRYANPGDLVAHQQGSFPAEIDIRAGKGNIPSGIPVDDGSVPDEVLVMPDIRPDKKVM